MSLTSEQKKDLKLIGRQLHELEKLAVENHIDLDVFISEYADEGFSLYATEKISQKSKSGKRKNILEKHGTEQKKSSVNNH